jgi:hypothetical protein
MEFDNYTAEVQFVCRAVFIAACQSVRDSFKAFRSQNGDAEADEAFEHCLLDADAGAAEGVNTRCLVTRLLHSLFEDDADLPDDLAGAMNKLAIMLEENAREFQEKGQGAVAQVLASAAKGLKDRAAEVQEWNVSVIIAARRVAEEALHRLHYHGFIIARALNRSPFAISESELRDVRRDRHGEYQPMTCYLSARRININSSRFDHAADFFAYIFLFVHEYSSHLLAEPASAETLGERFYDGWVLWAQAHYLEITLCLTEAEVAEDSRLPLDVVVEERKAHTYMTSRLVYPGNDSVPSQGVMDASEVWAVLLGDTDDERDDYFYALTRSMLEWGRSPEGDSGLKPAELAERLGRAARAHPQQQQQVRKVLRHCLGSPPVVVDSPTMDRLLRTLGGALPMSPFPDPERI